MRAWWTTHVAGPAPGGAALPRLVGQESVRTRRQRRGRRPPSGRATSPTTSSFRWENSISLSRRPSRSVVKPSYAFRSSVSLPFLDSYGALRGSSRPTGPLRARAAFRLPTDGRQRPPTRAAFVLFAPTLSVAVAGGTSGRG